MSVDLESILNTLSLPVSYTIFDSPQNPPYIIYRLDGTDNFSADDGAYVRRSNYLIELYTDSKDETTEKSVEDALDAAGIFWDKDETYIPGEELYFVLYTVQI